MRREARVDVPGIILDHYKHPQGRGLRERTTPRCTTSTRLRRRDHPAGEAGDGGKIEDVSYEGQGCSISQAAASVLNELITGTTVERGAAGSTSSPG